MHTGISAPCAYRFNIAAENQSQRFFDAALNRKLAWLPGEACKGRSIVRNQEGKDNLSPSLFGITCVFSADSFGFH